MKHPRIHFLPLYFALLSSSILASPIAQNTFTPDPVTDGGKLKNEKKLTVGEANFIAEIKKRYPKTYHLKIIETPDEFEDAINADMRIWNRTTHTLYFIRYDLDLQEHRSFPDSRGAMNFSGIIAAMDKEIRGLKEPLFHKLLGYRGDTLIKGITLINADIKEGFYFYGNNLKGVGALAHSAQSARGHPVVLEDVHLKSSRLFYPAASDSVSVGGLIGQIEPASHLILNGVTVDDVRVQHTPPTRSYPIPQNTGVGGVIGAISEGSSLASDQLRVTNVRGSGIENTGGVIGFVAKNARVNIGSLNASEVVVDRLTGFIGYQGFGCIIGKLNGHAVIDQLNLSYCLGKEKLSTALLGQAGAYRRGTQMGGVVGSIYGDNPLLQLNKASLQDIFMYASLPQQTEELSGSSFDSNLGCVGGSAGFTSEKTHDKAIAIFKNIDINRCYLYIDSKGCTKHNKPNRVGYVMGLPDINSQTLSIGNFSHNQIKAVAGEHPPAELVALLKQKFHYLIDLPETIAPDTPTMTWGLKKSL